MTITRFIVDGFDKETNEKLTTKIIEKAFPKRERKNSGHKKLEELLRNTKKGKRA